MVTPPPCQHSEKGNDESNRQLPPMPPSRHGSPLTALLTAPLAPATTAAASSASMEERRRRAQARTRQLRYREKQHQYEEELKASVATIRCEVHHAQLKLQSIEEQHGSFSHCAAQLPSSAPGFMTPDFLQIARNFVHCFRSGFQTATHGPWLPPAAESSSTAAASGRSQAGQEQIRFVQQRVHPDVLHGDLRGQNAFLEQWRRYTTFFGSLALHARGFELLVQVEGLAVCRVQLTLSVEVAACTFQHVLPRMLLPESSVLAARLLSKQLQVPMTLTLEFDEHGRVCRYERLVNFVAALQPLLSSYEDVAAALQGAHISADGQLGQDVAHRGETRRDARLDLAFLLSPEVDGPDEDDTSV
ncbi:hypothetical protein BBJ28_00024272 [Nothophytophthora sp. Chile5]|nr:hypothetical protein BBJ28_00024272 [Nothophytophthora sp. Chile5]